MSKPKVLIAFLTGVERQNWINPNLVLNLVTMARDARFDLSLFPVRDFRPVEAARNAASHTARQLGVDWLVQCDNDNFWQGNLLDIIVGAGQDKHIIGMPSGLGADGGALRYRMYPCGGHGAIDGPFQEEPRIGSGVLLIRSVVWKTITRGPWFKWVHGEGSELLTPDSPGSLAECEYFSDLARSHGLKLWNWMQPAGHFRTSDITGLVHTLAVLTEQARSRSQEPLALDAIQRERTRKAAL